MSKCEDIPSENVGADKTMGRKRKFSTDEDVSDHKDEVEKVEESSQNVEADKTMGRKRKFSTDEDVSDHEDEVEKVEESSQNVDADKTMGRKRKFCTDEDVSDHKDEVEKIEESSQNVDPDKTMGKKRKFCTDEDVSDHEDEVEKVEESSRKKAKIESFVTVLDGGMGRELDVNYPDPDFKDIWSAAHLLNQPGSVYHAHLSFISAGAEVITTSNYACVPAFLAKMDITDKMYDLIKVAGEQAQKAKISFENPSSIRVAGSIPPYGFSYMGMKIPDNSEIISSYAKIASVLYPYIDIFLCETMSSIDEAVTALSGVQTAKKDGMLGDRDLPVWLSFSLLNIDNVELHSGEKLEDALEKILGKFPGFINGLFLNCTGPDIITAALPVLIRIGKEHGVDVFGAYANRFSPITNKSSNSIEKSFKKDTHVRKLIDIPEEDYLEQVKTWIKLGCVVVGGCCGMGPKYIKKISEYVESSALGIESQLP